MHRIYNFSAGPAVLPEEVLQEAARGVVEIAGSGMSILEVSHRGDEYEAIHHDAEARMLNLLGLSAAEYQPLLLGGGASLQFAMVPMNFLEPTQTADFVNTGEWSTKAMKEAARFGTVHEAGSSADTRFSYIPQNLQRTPDARYLHITTNNTIEGTEWPDLPDTGATPLIADISSNIFSRPMAYGRASLLYAGAQKNAGPAGVTLIAVRKDFLATATAHAPVILQYSTHAKASSLYNTPPAIAVYVVGLVLRWIEQQGGLAAMGKRNQHKAECIYTALDRHADIYDPAVTCKADRSRMNITFRLRDPAREPAFLSGAAELGMEGLKGHRSVGGIRASVYNAFPIEGAVALADYIDQFARG